MIVLQSWIIVFLLAFNSNRLFFAEEGGKPKTKQTSVSNSQKKENDSFSEESSYPEMLEVKVEGYQNQRLVIFYTIVGKKRIHYIDRYFDEHLNQQAMISAKTYSELKKDFDFIFINSVEGSVRDSAGCQKVIEIRSKNKNQKSKNRSICFDRVTSSNRIRIIHFFRKIDKVLNSPKFFPDDL